MRLRSRLLEPAILLCFCLVMLSQVLLKNRQVSSMADEATHIYSGYRALRCKDYGFSREHPPFSKLVAAAPLLVLRPPVNCAPVDWQDEALQSAKWLYGGDWERILLWSRTATSVFALGLCLLVWVVSRRMFGLGAAMIATALLVFEPNFLASAGLVTTDVAPTLAFLLAVYALYLWCRTPSVLRGLLAGVAIGLTLVSKHSGVVVVPALGALAILDAFVQPSAGRTRWRLAGRNLLALLLMLIVASGVIWTVYAFQAVPRPQADLQVRPMPSLIQNRSLLMANTAEATAAFKRTHILPEAYVAGLGDALGIVHGGNTSGAGPIYMFGRIHLHGKWFFFPALLIVKYTGASLLLMALAATCGRSLLRRYRREVIFLGVPAVVYLVACTTARLNSGVRHTLPVLPLLLMLTAASCMELRRRFRWAHLAVPLLILLHVASSLHAYPFYDSYANEFWGGPSNLYKHLPNTDSDQAYRAVAEYMRKHPGVPCWIKTDFQTDPRAYGVPCQPFGASFWGGVPREMNGIVIVSSTSLQSVQSIRNAVLEPFAKAKPVARLGGSAMLVFRGKFDTTIAALYSELIESKWLLNQGEFQQSLEHAYLATRMVPGDVMARSQYCRALVANNDPQGARLQCNLAVALSSERERNREVVAGLIEAVKAKMLLDKGEEAEALEHARKAVAHAPLSGTARWEYCRALTANRKPAESQCYTARVLVLQQNVPHPRNLGPFSEEVAGLLYALEKSPSRFRGGTPGAKRPRKTDAAHGWDTPEPDGRAYLTSAP